MRNSCLQPCWRVSCRHVWDALGMMRTWSLWERKAVLTSSQEAVSHKQPCYRLSGGPAAAVIQHVQEGLWSTEVRAESVLSEVALVAFESEDQSGWIYKPRWGNETVTVESMSGKVTFWPTTELVKTSSQAGLPKNTTSVYLDMWLSDGLGSAKSHRKLIWGKGGSVLLFSVRFFFFLISGRRPVTTQHEDSQHSFHFHISWVKYTAFSFSLTKRTGSQPSTGIPEGLPGRWPVRRGRMMQWGGCQLGPLQLLYTSLSLIGFHSSLSLTKAAGGLDVSCESFQGKTLEFYLTLEK